MPRYIDADKVMDEINRIGGHNLCGWETIGVKALIDRQPTADVVPKSEYIQQIAEVQGLRQALLESKTEVAMDIIEDLEKSCSFSVMTCNEREIPETKVYNISSLKLAELKKKYTEENK